MLCLAYLWQLQHFVSFGRLHSPSFFETHLLLPLLQLRKYQWVDSRHGAGISTLVSLSELESTETRHQGKVKYMLRFQVGQNRVAKRFCGEFFEYS